MRILRDALKTAVFLLCLGTGARARAQSSLREPEQPQAFEVQFSSPANCGNREEFSEEILKRTERLRPAEAGEPALTFLVNVTRDAQGTHGQLAIREIDGTLSLRDVPGDDCPEVLSAMALIAALTVDPLARSDREVPVAARRRRVAPPAAALSASKIRAQEPSPAPAPPLDEAARRPGPGLRFGAGARVNAHGAVMPDIAWGLGAHLSVAGAGNGSFSPLVRAGVILARKGEIDVALPSGATARAEFEWVTARVELCPLRFGAEAAVTLRPCVFFDAGRLKGSGADIEPSRDKAVFWVASGAELALEARLVGPVTAGAELGLVLPFRRDRFLFLASETVVHEIPAAGLSAGLGLGLHFF